jgi:hypothetical protein
MRSPWGDPRPRGSVLSGRDAGSVTAEFAVVLPAVLLVLAGCLGAVQVAGQQVRLTDVAADAARALARGEGADRAAALVRRAVGGASLGSERRGEFVCARLSAPSAFGPFAAVGLTVSARSCALAGGL